MKPCKYCSKPTYDPAEICLDCYPALLLVQKISAKVLENIIRDVHIQKFMKTH
jgi:hypothetical protein